MAKPGLYRTTITLWSEHQLGEVNVAPVPNQRVLVTSLDSRFVGRSEVPKSRDCLADLLELLGPDDTTYPLFELEHAQQPRTPLA